LLRLLAWLLIAVAVAVCTARVILDLKQLDADVHQGRKEPAPGRSGAR
jgi:hypothetical protein